MIIMRSSRYNKNTTAALLGILESAGAYIYEDVLVISSLSKEELDKVPDGKHTFLFSFTTPHREHAYSDVKTLKKLFPGSVFIAGRPHASGIRWMRRQAGLMRSYAERAKLRWRNWASPESGEALRSRNS